MTVSALINEHKNFDPAQAQREYPWASRFVMGLPLAPWQRDFKWSEDQARRFIHSIWTGVHLGTYVVTDLELRQEVNGFRGVEYLHLSNCVIDGQQRLKALEMYITDQFAVPATDGTPVRWSEVDVRDRRRFQSTIFSRGTIRERDETMLRELYDVMNFGGVAHEEHERASTQPRLVRVGDGHFVDRSDTASLTAAQEQARHEAVFRYSRSRSPAAELVRARLAGTETATDDDAAGEEAVDAPRPR